MGKYDLTMKRLTSEFPEDYVRFALKVEQFVVERLDVEENMKLPKFQRFQRFQKLPGVRGM